MIIGELNTGMCSEWRDGTGERRDVVGAGCLSGARGVVVADGGEMGCVWGDLCGSVGGLLGR